MNVRRCPGRNARRARFDLASASFGAAAAGAQHGPNKSPSPYTLLSFCGPASTWLVQAQLLRTLWGGSDNKLKLAVLDHPQILSRAFFAQLGPALQVGQGCWLGCPEAAAGE